MDLNNITTYPYSLGAFVEHKQAILENNYLLTYGKKRLADGTQQLYATITSRSYPFEPITDGVKDNIEIFKRGKKPSASWTGLPVVVNGVDATRNIYLFLSSTTTYVSDSPKLPVEIEEQFDSSDIDLSATAILNKDNVYDVISECGAIFDPMVSYRQHAIVRSSINGQMYQKITDLPSVSDKAQPDPFNDKINWKKLVENASEIINTDKFVDIESNQTIIGVKTFETSPKKNNAVAGQLTLDDLTSLKDVTDRFLGKTDTAVNSDKVSNTEVSDIGGESVNKAVVVKTNEHGKIDDSFFSFNIIGNTAGLTLRVVANGTVDNKKTFGSIQEAYDSARKLIKLSPVTIRVDDGIYEKSGNGPVLNLTSFYDNSMISIIGNESNPDRCIIQIRSSQQGLYFTGKGLYINGFKIYQQESHKDKSVGVYLNHGASMILGPATIIDNCNIGILTTGLSYLQASNVTVTNCELAYSIDGASADLSMAKAQSCKYGCLAENNAIVYAKGSQFQKGNLAADIETIGYIARYNSIIRCEQTNVDTNPMDKPYNDETTSVPNSTNGILVF